MLDLLDKVLARIAVLTEGELWDDPSTEDGKTALRGYRGMLPLKRSTPEQKHDHPLVVARILNGSEGGRQGVITVRIIGGLHTHGDIDDGLVDIDRLLGLLLRIPEQRDYLPYALEEDVAWYLGDPEEGVQPHPKYYVTVDLEFTRAPVINND